MIAEKNSVINEAVIKLEVLSKDEQARLRYESLEKKRRDDIAREEYVEERGVKRTNLNAIIKMMNNLSLTVEQAMNVLEISNDEKPEYEELIKESKGVYNTSDTD